MVKKLQKKQPEKTSAAAGFNPASLLDNQVAQNVRESAQQIWAAGLAAFNKAQGEGSKVFDALVSEGMSLQRKTQNLAEQKFNAVASKMTGMAGDVGAKAGQHWDKLESIFEERVARALKSLGVPTSADIASLIARIDALSASAGFAAPQKASPKPTRAKATASKKLAPEKKKTTGQPRPAAAKKVAPRTKRAASPGSNATAE